MLAFATCSSAYSPHRSWRASLSPLQDRRVLVAASKTYAARICPHLIGNNARPIHAPLISNKSLPDSELSDLEEAILRLSDYDIVTFISPTAIKTFARKLRAICEQDEQGLLMLRASGIRMATLGANGIFLKEFLGVTPDILPPDPSLAGLANYLANDQALRGARVLCPVSKFVGAAEPPAIPDFIARLASAGFEVSTVLAYKSMPIEKGKVCLELKLLLDGNIDALLISNHAEASALWALLSEPEREALLSQVQEGNTLIIAHGSDTATAAAQFLDVRNVTTLQDWSSYQAVVHALEEKFMDVHSENGLLLPS